MYLRERGRWNLGNETSSVRGTVLRRDTSPSTPCPGPDVVVNSLGDSSNEGGGVDLEVYSDVDIDCRINVRTVKDCPVGQKEFEIVTIKEFIDK